MTVYFILHLRGGTNHENVKVYVHNMHYYRVQVLSDDETFMKNVVTKKVIEQLKLCTVYISRDVFHFSPVKNDRFQPCLYEIIIK